MKTIKLLLASIGIAEITLYVFIFVFSFLHMPIMLLWSAAVVVLRISVMKHEITMILQRSLRYRLFGIYEFENMGKMYKHPKHFENELTVDTKKRFNVSGNSMNKMRIPSNSTLRFIHFNKQLSNEISNNSTVLKHSFSIIATLSTILPIALMVGTFNLSDVYSIIGALLGSANFLFLSLLKTASDKRAGHLKNIAKNANWDNKYNSQLIGNVMCMSAKYK